MKKLVLLALSFTLMSPIAAEEKTAKNLIKKMSKVVGSMKKLKKLKDVEYTYIYRDNASGKSDISTERYIFNGELSWARYDTHEKHVLPNSTGTVIQSFDGNKTMTTLNGKKVDDPQAIKLADFLRKTNFYWFTMFQKLQDPGLVYSYEDQKEIDGIQYHQVRVGFKENVGDAQDTYLLYIHPETFLVDQFLFTVMDFGMTDPLLMKVEYREFNGIKLPFRRRYAPANWDGDITKDEWVDEIMNDIKFKNGFTRENFNL